MPKRSYKTRSSYHNLKYKRRLSSKRRTKKVFKMFVLSLTGLVLFSVAFYLYTLTLVLKEPFVKASGSTDFSAKNYNSVSEFNIAFVKLEDLKENSSKIKELYLYRINPSDSYILNISIPVNSVVEGFSKDKSTVSDLYFLGNAGDEKRGITNIKKYIVKSLAVNVDAYVLFDETTEKSLQDIGVSFKHKDIATSIRYRSFLKINKIFDILRANVKSDLSSIEAFKIITDSKNIKADKYRVIDLTENDLNNLPVFDDMWRSENNLDLNVNYRNSAIVLNSTSTKGLALWGSRIVKNTGASIVDVGNFDKEYTESTIYTNDYELPLVTYLINTLKVKKVKSTKDFLDDPFLASRADVLLIIGKDTAELY